MKDIVIQKEVIVDLYCKKKLGYKTIAKKLGCHYGVILRAIRKNNIKFRLRRIINKEKLIDLYINKKLSPVECALRCECCSKVIINTLKKYNIKIRTYGEVNIKHIIQKKDLKELYVNKRMRMKKIAKHFGCSTVLISRTLKKYNIQLIPIINIQKKKLIEMYVNRKISVNKLEKTFKCSGVAIRRHLLKYNINIRNIKEAYATPTPSSKTRKLLSDAVKKFLEEHPKIRENYYKNHPESRKLLREAKIKYIEQTKNNGLPISPTTGKNEYQLIREFELSNNIKFERQFRCRGFFIDGYCKKLNLVVEIDEKSHRRKQEKDLRRQQEITKELECQFIRIKDGW